MKKSIFTLLSAILLFSCSLNDDPPSTQSGLIEGDIIKNFIQLFLFFIFLFGYSQDPSQIDIQEAFQDARIDPDIIIISELPHELNYGLEDIIIPEDAKDKLWFL